MLATFNVHGERLSVWVTNREAIQHMHELQQGWSVANAPKGRGHPRQLDAFAVVK